MAGRYGRHMLCTAISDVYRSDERELIYDALQRVLGPGQPDWTPKGVYAYWDPTSHEILYLGLASDLPERFAQHNGILSHRGGNKTAEINDHFSRCEELGLTVLVQSKAIQLLEDIAAIDPTLGAVARNVIGVGEGQLIEIHRLVHGRWPGWNKTGGSTRGQRWATPARDLLDVLSLRRDSLFTARRGLRVVAQDLRIRVFESTIHAARMRAVMGAHNVGRPQSTPDESNEVVLKVLMLRDGHIVQDMTNTDDEIRRWVALLGTEEQWERDAIEHRSRFFDAVGSRSLSARDQEVIAILDAAITDAPSPLHVRATQDILAAGYLDQALTFERD